MGLLRRRAVGEAVLIAAVLLALSAAAAEPVKEVDPKRFYEDASRERVKTATARETARWLKKGKALLVDLRSPESFARSHLEGAVNLPGTELTTEAATKVIPSTTTRVVVYCDDNLGPTRMIALTTWGYPALKRLGYVDIYRLEPLWNAKDCAGKEREFGSGCPGLLPLVQGPMPKTP